MRILLMLLVLLTCDTAYAFSCMGLKTANDRIEESGLIFDGVVVKKERKTHKYTFRITKLWKGDSKIKRDIEIIAGLSWQNREPYIVGENYMVFATQEGDSYHTRPGWCGPDIIPRVEILSAIENYNNQKDKQK